MHHPTPVRDRTPIHFGAPWGGLLLAITTLTTALIGGALVLVVWQAPTGLRPWLILALLAVALIAGPLFKVNGYLLAPGRLEILRPGWRTPISLTGLTSAERSTGRTLAGVRLFGNGGYWSFTGLYWNSKLGRFRCFVNDPGRAVVLRLPQRTIVVSPDDPERFLSEVRVMAGLT